MLYRYGASVVGPVQVVAECHKRRVIHGDLKPENIINSSDKSRFVLIDFGTASICNGVHFWASMEPPCCVGRCGLKSGRRLSIVALYF
jgi:serine/threonine protein kinase